jgi:IstB-like ATP binding protein
MSEHIELNRTFWPVKDDTDYDSDRFRLQSAFAAESAEWSELLQSKRVVILAEAGTGKTHELVNIAREMINDGKSAFFCRIEDLAELSVEEAITEGSYDQLKAWKQQEEEAWFFLDSVDEARLANPRDFERALRRVAKELGDVAKRSHIYITSRVSDWMANADRALVNEILPCPQSNAISLSETHIGPKN